MLVNTIIHSTNDYQNSQQPSSKPLTSQDPSKAQSRPPRQPFTNNANGTSVGRKSSRSEVSQTNGVKSGRVDTLARQENLSRTGSEADSLLDLYKKNGDTRVDTYGPFTEEEDPESAKWIHRDKLARIESEELQQAGIRLPPPGQIRSGSKMSRRARSKDRSNSITTESTDQWPSTREEKRQRVASSVHAEEGENEQESWDLRTPDEIAADPYEEGGRNNLKKTSSRIPVFASSPLPVPQEHIERDTPLQRKRNASGTWNKEEESIAYNRGRERSHSDSSQAMVDDTDINESPTPNSPHSSKSFQQVSPSKPKGAKATPVTGARKTSATGHTRSPSSQQKTRTASGTTKPTTTARPVTRGNDGRPSTAVNRPEGDPPWLATMYKPDPRLPPDQQLLPTHAKRLQQEQWEREGNNKLEWNDKHFSAYDTQFAPLAVHTHDGMKQPAGGDPVSEPENDDDNAWPLKAAPKVTDVNGRPETSGTDHGGYSTMPKVQSTPPVGIAPSPKIIQKPIKTQEATRPPAAPEDDGHLSKGCGCCIVM
jgi:hypothetical protein